MKITARVPGQAPRKNKVIPKLYTTIVLCAYMFFGMPAVADKCVSCTVRLSNNYKVEDPDHLPDMPCCVGCGGE